MDTLSLGVQSLDPDGLAFLGRRHTAEQTRGGRSRWRWRRFHTVSIDLIYGLPGPDAPTTGGASSTARWSWARTTSPATS